MCNMQNMVTAACPQTMPSPLKAKPRILTMERIDGLPFSELCASGGSQPSSAADLLKFGSADAITRTRVCTAARLPTTGKLL